MTYRVAATRLSQTRWRAVQACDWQYAHHPLLKLALPHLHTCAAAVCYLLCVLGVIGQIPF